MFILLELCILVVLFFTIRRFVSPPWKQRGVNFLKAWFTVRAFWILLAHEVALEDGGRVTVLKIISDTIADIDIGTFLVFVCLAALIKFIGILASMKRWDVLLQGQGIVFPFRHLFGTFLIGRFIGTFLPSTAGLDGYKLYDASRFSGKTVEASAATALEKIMGVTGIFLTYAVALPFGLQVFHQFFGARTVTVALLSIAVVACMVGAVLLLVWFPGLVKLFIQKLPLPKKKGIAALAERLADAAVAYRDKKGLVLYALFLSFTVHFTTAAMYYFTARAIGSAAGQFWQITLGSSIQILATVLSPITIAGEGIREAAQYLLLGNLIGPGNAIVSAALGFWAAEALTLAGGVFWWIRKADYTPQYCRVHGQKVDFTEAAKAAITLNGEKNTEQMQSG
ncbi:YbhN family protein [Thermodesulfobacteriota bacterium]